MGKKAGTGISDDGRNGSFTEQEQENADAVSALVLDNGINFTGMLISCRPWRTAPEPNRGGAAIKYYDLAQVGDEMAGDHYRRLAPCRRVHLLRRLREKLPLPCGHHGHYAGDEGFFCVKLRLTHDRDLRR